MGNVFLTYTFSITQVVDGGNKSVIIYELSKEYELEWISNYPTIFQFHKVVMNIFNLIYIIFELRVT